jgi:cysteine desulfurase
LDRIVYLDNSATTKPCEKAIEYMNNCLKYSWGNPSSLHTIGVEAESVLNSARNTVSEFLKAAPEEIIFAGSGTEANNTAIMSAAAKTWGNRVITTEIEHPSVLKTVKRLEERGFEVIRLKVDKNGIISLDELKSALNDKTVLVSIMLVNNEIGSIQPVGEAVKLAKALSPRCLFHTDAVQAFGKLPLNVKTLGVDLLTASAHKIHAPKGFGFLYRSKKATIPPLITGGGQENGLRSGTEAVHLAAALQGAILDLPELSTELQKITTLRDYAAKLFSQSDFARVISPENALPYIINITVPGYRSETMLHFLEGKNIFVSSGSACAKGETSHVLAALGLSKREADSALRISFSRYNTMEDIDALFAALSEATKKLRRSDK